MGFEHKTLLSVFDHFVRTTPNAPFLVEERSNSLSYLEAGALINRLLLKRLPEICPRIVSRPSSSVVLVSPNNTLLLLAILTLWRLSCNAVPIQPRAEPDLWTGMFACSRPSLVIAAPSVLEAVEKCLTAYNAKTDSSVPCVSLLSLIPNNFVDSPIDTVYRVSNFIPACRRWLNSSFSDQLDLRDVAGETTEHIDPCCAALTLFTSSAVDQSTVKGVSYTHSFLVSSAIRTALSLGRDVRDFQGQANRHLGWLPLSHCFELGISFCSIVLFSGGSYIIFDNSVSAPDLPASTTLPKQLLAALAHYEDTTSLSGVPFIAQGIANSATLEDTARLRRLRYLNCAGAPTTDSVFQWFASKNISYADACGTTELLWVARRRATHSDEAARGLSVCPGLMGVLQKMDPDDDFGELIILGENLPTKYDNIDSPAFSYDPSTKITVYRSGDLYRHSSDICPAICILADAAIPVYDSESAPLTGITYIGRVDDTVVLSTGEKIDALGLEQTLDKHVNVERSAIVGNVHSDAVVALIQPDNHHLSTLDWEALTDDILRVNISLPFEKRLQRRTVFFVQQLPTTAKNTLHRKRLRKIITSLQDDSEIPSRFPPPHGAPTFQLSASTQIDQQLECSEIAPRTAAALTPSTLPSISPDLRNALIIILANVFDVPRDIFDRNSSSLVDLPLTSLASVEIANAIKNNFEIQFSPAEMYGARTLDDLCLSVQNRLDQREASPLSAARPLSSSARDALNPAASSSLESPFQSHQICITGAACRFVGGIDSLAAYWAALKSPDSFLEKLSRVRPDSRWPSSVSEGLVECPTNWLDDAAAGITTVRSFANFFGIPPAEAEAMSLNTRLVMQMAYEAIEDAGIAPKSLNGKNWGVFGAVNESGWRLSHSLLKDSKNYARDMLSLADDVAVGRLAYYLNLTGPAVDIKTACSSTAVAIHQALLSIRNGDCDAAIVIGATTHVHPAGGDFKLETGIASPSGRCLPFSQWADGFVPGEGASAIVLQRTQEAVVRPYASLRASAVVQDGTSRGFLSPNPQAQKRLLKIALQRSGCVPDEVCYIEAHGTGTQIGDAVELLALTNNFKEREYPLHIGSCKAVIGHTEECAGLAGVLKAILCFRHNMIPPQPFTGPLNDAFENSETHFVLSDDCIALPHDITSHPRLIGVSSFGLSGTQAHIVLQEPPKSCGGTSCAASTAGSIFTLSAATADDLQALARRYLRAFGKQHLRRETVVSFCATSLLGRDHHAVRRAFYVDSWRTLLDKLEAVAIAVPRPPAYSTSEPSVGLWFGMPLHQHEIFFDTDNAIYRSERRAIPWKTLWDFYSAQLALARTLVKLGVRVNAVDGEKGGELAAAVFSGVVPPSAVFQDSDEEQAHFAIARCEQDILEQHLIMCTDEEAQIVGRHKANCFSLRGTRDGLLKLASNADLHITIADEHEPLRPCRVDAQKSFAASKIPIVSGHTCGILDEEATMNPAYWARVQHLPSERESAFSAIVEKCDVVVDMLAPGERLENLLCRLYESGCSIDWSMISPATRPMERLPSYVWAASTDM